MDEAVTTDPSAAEQWKLRVETLRRNQFRRQGNLRALRTLPRLSSDAILCVMVVYNETLRLPDTLRHYREIGVDRFAVIDNLSNDGTVEYLQQQPDCDIYQMEDEFRNSAGGAGWRSGVIHSFYGCNRWVIITDADEHLVYDSFETKSLRNLIQHLEEHHLSAFPCLMIDMYSERGILTAVHEPERRLLDTCRQFDGSGYSQTYVEMTPTTPAWVRWAGGPAERYLNAPRGWLSKVPLMYWESDSWSINPHVAYPFEKNFCEPWGGLMHFKWLSDFADQVSIGVARNQYAENSKKYRLFQQAIAQHGDLNFVSERTQTYESSQSMVRTGLVSKIF
ncbi:hypothetical protein RMSM_03961 [Rhodopirellula maiorica SM1]|uniref:Glycosyl transferase family 2 n=1 Tax=Rhodopirellula maiorica SM1 TaxID=1265738 RepID=M5RIT3_9BACT|nr:glycosyltransferase family 2 protein [Rhodopirellula maiorica]EMI19111.1 hypothetical protein RMSM_03961 [Rhodopirellula maiorica SM1]